MSDILLFLQYMQEDSYGWQQTLADAYLETKTDENGRFSFSDVDPGLLTFRLVPLAIPDETTKYDLISVQIGEIPYAVGPNTSPEGTVFFSLPADAQLNDIKIRVKAKMRVRVQVVFRNGMPLVNYPLIVTINYEASNGGTYGSQREFRTDIDGYLTHYMSVGGTYTIAATYKGLTDHTGRFLLSNGEDRDNLRITFDSPPLPRYPTAVGKIDK